MKKELDIITVEVLWGRLISIVDEVDAAVMRTAFSSIIREGHDYSCVLFDRRGMLLAQASCTAPGHTGGMTRAAKRLVKEYFPNGGDLEEGDVLITNDPWLLSGHLPDVAVFTPIFHHEKVVAFAANIFHHLDIGGALDAKRTEVYEEGLQIPVLKIYKKNIPNEDFFKIIRANIRVPDQVIGDLMSQIAANHLSSVRVKELLDGQNWENLDELADEIFDHTELAMRSSIEKIPDGIYTYEGEIERPGRAAKNVKVKLAMEVKGSNICADFAGSASQVAEGINCVLNYTFAYYFYAIKSIMDPFIPNNEGCVRPLEVVAPKGSIFNCTYPAAVVARNSTGMYIPGMVYEVLADVIPDRVIAGCGAAPTWWPTFSGYKHNASRFILVLLFSGGLGARSIKDGVLATFPANVKNVPVEIIESVAPILCKKKEFICDSGGAGKFRGGMGQEFVVEIPKGDIGPRSNTEITEVLIAGRFKNEAKGLMGGKSGNKGELILNGKRLDWGEAHLLKPGDIEIFRPPGGGGFYNPLQREVELIENDVLNGYVSIERAKEDYGVIIDETNLKADMEATKKLREERLANKSY